MSNPADSDKSRETTADGRERPRMRGRLRAYAQLMRIDRPIGIWLLLWPVLWALWISAHGHPDERIFVIFVLGTFVTEANAGSTVDVAHRDVFTVEVQRAGRGHASVDQISHHLVLPVDGDHLAIGELGQIDSMAMSPKTDIDAAVS